jgi:hypothetical protein
MNGQRLPIDGVEFGPEWTEVVQAAEQVFERGAQRKGDTVRLWLCKSIYVNSYIELAQLLSLPDKDGQDRNARQYLLALRSGQKPDVRPECGYWLPIVEAAEDSFDKYPSDQRSRLMPKVLDSFGVLQQFQSFPLKELLASADTEQKSHSTTENQSPKLEQLDAPELLKEAQLPPEIAALAKDGCRWLTEHYVPYSRETSPEGFEDFHEDCGIFDLAAVSARRVCIPIGNGEYTPLSIALVAKPGAYAKSTTAKVAVRVLQAAGLGWRLGSDETTPQKLLTDMSGQHVARQYCHWDLARKDEYKERKAMAAQVAWYCDEFGELVKSINKPTGPMADLKKLILKFDNCPDVYSTSTIARDREEVKKPFLSFLGVMTPTSIKKSAKENSDEWGDGTWSRFVFSCASDDDGIDAPFKLMIPVPASLSEPLRAYHERLGKPEIEIEEITDKKGDTVIDYAIQPKKPLPEILMNHKPIEEYWTNYRSALKKMLKDVPDDLKASYLRIPTRALRVAALFASFEGLNYIELRHWAKAQEVAERWRKNLHRFYAQVNVSAPDLEVTLEDKILDYLNKRRQEEEKRKKVDPGWMDGRQLYRNLSKSAALVTPILKRLSDLNIIECKIKQDGTKRIPLYRAKEGGSSK